MRERLALQVLTAAIPIASAHAADGWVLLPEGNWGYQQQVTTTGVFTCLSTQFYRPGGSCLARGNTLVLTSGASTLQVTFTGFVQDVLATNDRDNGPVVMGTFTKAITGAPFTTPSMLSEAPPLFDFRLSLMSSNGSSDVIRFGYNAADPTSLRYNCCEAYRTYVQLGLGAQPAGINYSGALLDNFEGQDIFFNTAPATITSKVGLVPEHSTFVLLATGLGALAMIGRTRRRQRVG